MLGVEGNSTCCRAEVGKISSFLTYAVILLVLISLFLKETLQTF